MEGSGVGLQLQDFVMLHFNDSKCDDFFEIFIRCLEKKI